MKEGNGEAVSFFHFSLIRTVGCAEGTLVRQKKQKLSFFLCFVLTYPYRWLRRRYSRSTNKKAKTSVFSLFCAHLSVPLAAPKVLSFDKKSKNFRFFFVLCSLIRTFALAIGSPPHHD